MTAVGKTCGATGTDVVRAGPAGPAHWLVFDACSALGRTGIDPDGVIRRCLANETLARRLGDETSAWGCREVLTVALRSAGRVDEAVQVAEELVAHYRSRGETAPRLRALGELVLARFAREEFERALDELTEALVELSRLGLGDEAAHSAYVVVAEAASAAEMFEIAASYLRRCERARHQLAFVAHQADVVRARNELRWANRLELMGNLEEAAARYREALRAAVRMQGGDVTRYAWRSSRFYEGAAWAALDEPDLAMIALMDAGATEVGTLQGEDALIVRLALARACARRGDLDEASAHLEIATGLPDPSFSRQWHITASLTAAEIERARHGDHPGLDYVRHAAAMLAHTLWRERERRLEAVMVRMQMLELAAENERVGQEASLDPLTGLANRRTLDVALEDMTRADTVSSLLFVDLDDFKTTNDSFSHAVGDAVLREIAKILRRECRENDVVARYGGDEFVLILKGAPLRTGARVGERIRAAVNVFPWEDIAPGLTTSVSVGVAEYRPGMELAQALATADTALYVAKQQGRDRVAVA
ncbi:MAG: GGDEF domain-containing protein [Acidothermus sp.]|nr:GGDEF domain-containing protein [Acidothermus sp.]MCL6538260.1 GGDEF domain-containing protein [Acidothermus sp.]